MGDDLIGAALGRGEAGDGFALSVGGDGELIDQVLLGFRFPIAAAGFFDEAVDPFVTHDLNIERFIGQPFTIPINGNEVDGGFFIGVGHLLLRAKADVVVALMDDDAAPDYARIVDIHRKPGYDPVELFIDPDIRLPKVRLALKLLRKQLGFRTLMDVIPLKPQLVKGTHGRPAASPQLGPLLIGSRRDLARDRYLMVEVKDLILRHFV